MDEIIPFNRNSTFCKRDHAELSITIVDDVVKLNYDIAGTVGIDCRSYSRAESPTRLRLAWYFGVRIVKAGRIYATELSMLKLSALSSQVMNGVWGNWMGSGPKTGFIKL